jgi:hypothetical protein
MQADGVANGSGIANGSQKTGGVYFGHSALGMNGAPVRPTA